MELPFYLKTLEPLPGALDILRYFGQLDSETADSEEIADVLELSDRRFSKAIRRLVTKGYVMMDGDQVYRLTDQGSDAVEELTAYDEATGGGLHVEASVAEPAAPEVTTIVRRMIAAIPQSLVAAQPTDITIGFHPATMQSNVELAVRVSLVNGQPDTPEDILFTLSNDTASQSVSITPGLYDRVRVRLQAVQLGPNPGDYNPSGGMYVDVPVTAEGNVGAPAAYGTDINLQLS